MERIDLRILDKCHELGIDYNQLKTGTQKKLNDIEQILVRYQSERTEAIKKLQTTAITPTSIAKELGISRTTLYNNDKLLMNYIESSLNDIEKENPYTTITNLKNELREKNKQIQQLMTHDIDLADTYLKGYDKNLETQQPNDSSEANDNIPRMLN